MSLKTDVKKSWKNNLAKAISPWLCQYQPVHNNSLIHPQYTIKYLIVIYRHGTF